MQNVGMNIADKSRRYEEIYRVLKPNGRFPFQEMGAGAEATTYVPLPWATESGDNFLISMQEMLEVLTQSGLMAEYCEDVSDAPLPFPAKGTKPPTSATEPGGLCGQSGRKADNAPRSLREGQIRRCDQDRGHRAA